MTSDHLVDVCNEEMPQFKQAAKAVAQLQFISAWSSSLNRVAI